jgi:O-antigen/teichoic acid export membrane protein
MKALAGCGAVFALPELAGLALMRIDYPVLAYMVHPKQIGLYAVALAIAGGQAATASPVSQVCFRLASGTQDPTGPARLLRQFRIFQAVFATIAIAAIAATPIMIAAAFGAEFLAATGTARWLTAAMAIWSCSQLLENGMRGLGAAMPCAWANLGALVVTTGLAPILVTHRGILGMGIAIFVGQALSLIAKASLFSRQYGFRCADFWGLNLTTFCELLHAARRMGHSRARRTKDS